MKKIEQIKSMDTRFFVVMTMLLTLAIPVFSPIVHAFDAPPKDQGHSGPGCDAPDSKPDNNPCQQEAGDPITIKDGNFRITESDFVIPGAGFSLAIDRSYNSQNNFKEGAFGFGWTFNYNITLVELSDSDNNQVIIKRGNGIELIFQVNSDGSYTSPKGRFLILTKSAGTYALSQKNGNRWQFNSSGRLTLISDPNNNQMSFTYDSAGKLSGITDSSGRSLVLTYNTSNKITSVVDPANRTFSYIYDAENNLISYTDPNGNKTEYAYDVFHRLMAIKDAKGVEIVRNTYGNQNKITQQFMRGGAFDFTYYDDRTRVCDRRNFCTTYYFNETGNPTRIVKPAVGTSTRTYDQDLNLTILTDENNNSWNYTYDVNGNLLTVTDPNNHTTQYTYESNFNKLSSTTDSLNNTTNFEYDAKGNLTKIINALNQVTVNITSYDTTGNPLEIEDANGIKSLLSYDVHGRLISTTKGNATTSFTYDVIGMLTEITLPDSLTLNFSYDSASRLTEIKDGSGNRLKYTLDVVGNILSKEIFDNTNTLTRKKSSVYNDYDLVKESITADGRKILYEYDNSDNLINTTDALGQTSLSTFDGVDRLTRITDFLSGNIQLTYDRLDRLTRVTDPTGLSTQFTYDKVGNLLTLLSPDTGQTTNTYNTENNLKSSTDARGVAANYSYDALNRLIGISYLNSVENITMAYDDISNGNNGIGQLTGYVDESGNTVLNYDTKGQLKSKMSTIEGKAYTIVYRYDTAGKLTQLTYPSGRTVTYVYNSLGQIVSVKTTSDGITKTLASNISYLPFGPLQSLTYSNGLILNQTFDQNYRLVSKEVEGVSKLNFSYSAINNITSLTDDLNSSENQSFGYDKLSRLTTATGIYGELAFEYDKFGNRLSETNNGTADSYNYSNGKHQLDSIIGGINKSFTFDEAGNTLSKNDMTFAYNASGRLTQVTNNGVTSNYLYNAKGERVIKKVGSDISHFHYDFARQLIAETTTNGEIIKEYIYIESRLLATIDLLTGSENVYFVHSDHLGTPKTLTNESGQSVWRAVYEPFGGVNVIENTVKFSLRFPGQYFDEETGLNYNYFRFYDPNVGRYITSDPIGFEGGINQYAYVDNNPLTFMDPWGLFTISDAKDSLKKKKIVQKNKGWIWDGFSDTQIFDEWLQLERANKGWLKELTPCPRQIDVCNGKAANPDNNVWKDPGSANSEHPGAMFEIRSKPTTGGHANQCTFDRSGKVLSSIPAAGTADFVSHGFNFGHTNHDLRTWWLAKDLNRKNDYYDVRPVIIAK